MPTSISVKNLEVLLKKLIERLRESDIKELSFEDDLYWCVPLENINSFPEIPELTIGSIKDDIEFLNSLIEEEYVTDFLELERLSSLLRFINKKLVK